MRRSKLGLWLIICWLMACSTGLLRAAPFRASSRQELNTALVQAARGGDAPSVRRLLAQGANPNARDQDGSTPLRAAIQGATVSEMHADTLPILKLLLAHGADVHLKNASGQTVVTQAARQLQPDVLQFLLAEVPSLTPPERAMLSQARVSARLLIEAQLGHVARVKTLLERGADPNVAAPVAPGYSSVAVGYSVAAEADTPLMLAADNNPTGRNPDVSASGSDCAEVVRVLLQHGAKINARNTSGETALMHAAWAGTLPPNTPVIIKILLRARADLNARTNEGKTALIGDSAYIRTPDVGSVKLLLKAGANPNAHDNTGITALMMQSAVGRGDAIQLLLARGAQVEARDKAGETALMKTSAANIARLLIQSGANVNARDKQGKTLLMRTMGNGYGGLPVAEVLLARGADLNARDKSGHTVVAQAVGRLWPEHLALLLRRARLSSMQRHYVQRAQLSSRLIDAVRFRKMKQVRMLLRQGADPNATYQWGVFDIQVTSLMSLVDGYDRTSEAIARVLLSSGAKVDRKNRAGETALMQAAQNGNVRFVRFLLNHRARPDLRDVYGETALMRASSGYIPPSTAASGSCMIPPTPAILTLLLARGANVNARAKNGATALILATQFEYNVLIGAEGFGGQEAHDVLVPYRRHIAEQVVGLLLFHGTDVNARTKDGNSALKSAEALGSASIVRLLQRAGAKN